MGADQTKYSDQIKGDHGNYEWAVRFDLTGCKYLGITQIDETGRVKDRVLLSPGQVTKLKDFLRSR